MQSSYQRPSGDRNYKVARRLMSDKSLELKIKCRVSFLNGRARFTSDFGFCNCGFFSFQLSPKTKVYSSDAYLPPSTTCLLWEVVLRGKFLSEPTKRSWSLVGTCGSGN
jgi:hypothetical protein